MNKINIFGNYNLQFHEFFSLLFLEAATPTIPNSPVRNTNKATASAEDLNNKHVGIRSHVDLTNNPSFKLSSGRSQ